MTRDPPGPATPRPDEPRPPSRRPDPAETILLWIYGAIVAAWPIRHLVITALFRRLDVLTPRSPRYGGPEPPPVTAVIPAKDEEEALPACLDSVRAQIIRTSKSSSSTTAAPTAPARSPAGPPGSTRGSGS